ncbi:MAG TPA: hypothetical protein VMT68_05010 [Caulobacteraceae bacterium]|nr:hypothetical protein [Caulobacteraceae bacterium]
MGQFIGVMLIAFGALIAGLCGLCTLVVAGVSLTAPHDPQGYGGGGMVAVALLLGGLPTLFGAAMIWAGIIVLRNARRAAQPPVRPETFE